MAKRKPNWRTTIASFAGHTLVGTALFLLLCSTAIGLSLVMHLIRAHVEVPPFSLLMLKGLEQVVVSVDAVLFVVYLVVSAVRRLKELLK